MIVALDFDGTLVSHEYPSIGQDIGAVPVLQALVANGHQLILWTMRDHHKHVCFGSIDYSPEIVATERDCLSEAINWFVVHNIPLWGVNQNPDQNWSSSPKAYAHIYIDDAALGVPLIRFKHRVTDKPFVDWLRTAERLEQLGFINMDQFSQIKENWDYNKFEQVGFINMDQFSQIKENWDYNKFEQVV